MINIVIPMAGHGSRFSKAGYKEPKPLIPIKGKPMIELVIENLKPSKEHRFIFICQSEHLRDYYLRDLLEKKSPGCKIIEVTQVTEGAACSVLLAKEFINNQDQLMIANCDQYIDVDINKYLAILDEYIIDGLIMTMKAYDDKWSFIKLNDKNEISLIVEKEISVIDAILGSQVQVKTPHGDIPITIDPGTEHGRNIRVNGKGVPDMSIGLGDLYITVKVKIPKNVSSEEKDTLQKLKESNNFVV
jgi:NDP-sugar pyrophosphorylase family protein